MAKNLVNSDEAGGTTILDDGTKVYWMEGGSAEMIIKNVDGTYEHTACDDGDHPIIERLAETDGEAEESAATAEEEAEWQHAWDTI